MSENLTRVAKDIAVITERLSNADFSQVMVEIVAELGQLRKLSFMVGFGEKEVKSPIGNVATLSGAFGADHEMLAYMMAGRLDNFEETIISLLRMVLELFETAERNEHALFPGEADRSRITQSVKHIKMMVVYLTLVRLKEESE